MLGVDDIDIEIPADDAGVRSRPLSRCRVLVMVPAGFAILLVGRATGVIGEAPCRLPGRSAGRAHAT
jgi:hypothetical protein